MTTSFRLPPLVADGGELRLARRVASFVYGRREVEWPEDIDDPEELLPDGREFGWVAKLDDSEPGLSERRFVRADVKINAAEGYSDVEQVLDDSALRAGGEVYFESVIEGDGLGRLVPGVDFDEGHLVDVRFWGRILKDQLVTSIDWTDDEPSVSLGGQSIRDFDELARARSEMVRLINGERAERVDDVGKVNKKADAAQSTANIAVGETAELREALAGDDATTQDLQAALDELNQQLQEEGETEQSLPLIQAYISANTRRWALQQQVDEMQDRVSQELAEQQIAMKEEFEADRANRPERVIATAAGSSNPDHPVTSLSNGNWRIRLNDVAGATIIADIWELAGDQRINMLHRQYASSSSVFNLTLNSAQVFSAEWIRTPGFVRSVNDTWTGSLVLSNQRQWYRDSAAPEIKIGASGTSNFDATVSVRWKGPWGYYRIQLRAGDEVLAEKEARGSSNIYQDIPMTMTVSVSNVVLPANTEVRLWMYRWNNGPYSSGYTYNRLVTRASWTERNV